MRGSYGSLVFILLSFQTASAHEKDLDFPPTDTPATVRGYQLETLTPDQRDFKVFNDSYLPTKQPNSRHIFDVVMACFPAESNFKFEVKAQTGYKTKAAGFSGDEDINLQEGFYAGIVAEVPLFSASENSRAREREYDRRSNVAALVGSFTGLITSRNLAIRKIALFRSLERREQLRVKTGLVPVSDQVAYLEKIANEYQKRDQAKADIEAARLQLLAHCSLDRSDYMASYLDDAIRAMD